MDRGRKRPTQKTLAAEAPCLGLALMTEQTTVTFADRAGFQKGDIVEHIDHTGRSALAQVVRMNDAYTVTIKGRSWLYWLWLRMKSRLRHAWWDGCELMESMSA